MLDDSHDQPLYQEVLQGVPQVGIAPGPFALLQTAAERQAKLAQSVMATNQAVGQVWLTLGQQSLLASQQTAKLWTEFFLKGFSRTVDEAKP